MTTLLDAKALLSAVGGFTIGENKSNCCFFDVQTDSRNVVPGKKCMFVPLVGEFQDGHKYIEDVLKKEPGVILLNESEYKANIDKYEGFAKNYPEVMFVAVKNTLHGLQDAAEAYVEKVCKNMLKICITGSSGKTTTKEIAVSVFKQHFGEDAVAYTRGNFNSETGLPLSVFKIRGNEKVGIFEMGMNRVNEIGEISKVFKAKYGIITNIGTAHIGILGSRQNIAEEKRKAFNYIPCDGAAFVPADDDFADYCLENVKGKCVRFGAGVSQVENGVQFIKNNGLKGTVFTLDGVEINLPLCGEYNYQNALGVAALAKECGISAQEIKAGLEKMVPVSGRMDSQEIELKNGKTITVIADCYNANPDSMGKVIDFCNSLELNGKKIFILGDMKELGEKSEEAHCIVGKKCKESHAHKVILVGPDMHFAKEVCTSADYYENNTSEDFEKIATELLQYVDNDDLVLLKGSHSMSLEKIIPLIAKEGGDL